MTVRTFRKEISRLTKGLLFVSESEYPFEIQDWGNLDEVKLQAKIISLPEPHEALAVKVLFDRYTKMLERSGDEQMKNDVTRYRELQAFLLENAQNITVWRSGKIQVGIHIVISVQGGTVLVLKTISVET